MKAVFLDRDGTTIVDPEDLRVDHIEEVRLFPESLEALHKLAELDYSVFLITNQAGIAEGLVTEDEFYTINNHFLKLVEPSGLHIIKTYMCPHPEQAHCACRKPKPGMLLQAAKEYGIDLETSWMIGDRQSDIMAGVNAGTKTILVQTGNSPVVSAEADYTAATLLDAINHIASTEA
jgi:D-glycero-D-manno-heptose 1,7-bisphosphate phosphatase